MSFLLLLLGAVALVLVDTALQGWRFPLTDRPMPLHVKTADGWTVVAWHRPAVERKYSVPVVLCHGLANNHAMMDFRQPQNLAVYLSRAGFEVYSVDLRGAGGARAPDEGLWEANFDDHVRFDAPALVDAICKHAGAAQVAWVGHSLGGLVALAGASSSLSGKVAALATLGSPLFFQFPSRTVWLARLAQWISVWGQFETRIAAVVAPLAGLATPPSVARATANFRNLDSAAQPYLVANVFAPMWRGVLAQLEDWTVHDVFRSADGQKDYRSALTSLTMPLLVLGGTVDLLAPPDLIRKGFELFTSPRKQLQLFGRSYGHSAEYGHGDLVVGRRAQEEVYPVILQFLEKTCP